MTETLSPPNVDVAARAVDASKIYGSGEAEVRALNDDQRRVPDRPAHRDHGPVGIGQVDAAALHGRPRPAHVGSDLPRRRRDQPRQREGAHAHPARQARVHLPVVQPDPDAQRAREHDAADVAGRHQARPGLARHHRADRPPRGPPQPPPGRALGWPAAAGRGRPCAAQQARRSSSPTSPPATSTRARAPRSSPSCARRSTTSARPS